MKERQGQTFDLSDCDTIGDQEPQEEAHEDLQTVLQNLDKAEDLEDPLDPQDPTLQLQGFLAIERAMEDQTKMWNWSGRCTRSTRHRRWAESDYNRAEPGRTIKLCMDQIQKFGGQRCRRK